MNKYTLEKELRQLREKKKILLTSHAVLGFPDFTKCEQSIKEMNKVGVDIIELQIPFSEPMADGPFFTFANEVALRNGVSVESSFSFAEKVAKEYPNQIFVFMTYYNIIFKYGISRFLGRSKNIGIKGLIVPDLPIEEAEELIEHCVKSDIAPIFMVAPNSTSERIKKISSLGGGFLYCQARAGVTGNKTEFDSKTNQYIDNCKQNSNLPIAFGFGIQKKSDVDFLVGKIDIAICCTEAVRVLNSQGPEEMGIFLSQLRS